MPESCSASEVVNLGIGWVFTLWKHGRPAPVDGFVRSGLRNQEEAVLGQHGLSEHVTEADC